MRYCNSSSHITLLLVLCCWICLSTALSARANTLEKNHDDSIQRTFPTRRLRKRSLKEDDDEYLFEARTISKGKGKGTSHSYTKASKSTKCKSSSSRSRHGKGKGGKGKGSKGSDSAKDCLGDELGTSSPTISTASPSVITESPTASPTGPTLSPTRVCESQQGRLDDIARITTSIVGVILPGTPEQDALDWLVSVDQTNTCNDGGVALTERFVLALFFYNTGGENWSNRNGWLSLSDHCTWAGIECTVDQRVGTISMNQNNLLGEIPSALSSLESLSVLKLFDNALEGTIPSSLYQLPNLLFLDVEANNLQGNLFESAVFNATSLVRFRASFNQFDGTTIPPEIGRLSSLQQLWIADCGIVGTLPAEINQLVDLNDLFVYNNTLTGPIPDDLSELQKLKRLDLSHNHLTGSLPSSIGLLLELEKIVLSGNDLTGPMPSTIGNLQLMTDLLLNQNSMDGPLPHDFDFLISLQNLDLEGNAFTGRLPDYSTWDQLRYININNNHFNGTIHPSLFTKQGLEYVYFANNTLHGNIPSNYGNASNLIDLWLNGNVLTGPIPNVGPEDLSSITEILFHHNALSGDVPHSLCDKRNASSAEYLMDFGTLHADCEPPAGSDVPNNPCPAGCCTTCFIGKIL